MNQHTTAVCCSLQEAKEGVYKHVHNFLIENRIIPPNQSGFTKGDSAINQLIDISNYFGRA